MILIDGKKIAAELREELKKEVSDLKAKYKDGRIMKMLNEAYSVMSNDGHVFEGHI